MTMSDSSDPSKRPVVRGRGRGLFMADLKRMLDEPTPAQQYTSDSALTALKTPQLVATRTASAPPHADPGPSSAPPDRPATTDPLQDWKPPVMGRGRGLLLLAQGGSTPPSSQTSEAGTSPSLPRVANFNVGRGRALLLAQMNKPVPTRPEVLSVPGSDFSNPPASVVSGGRGRGLLAAVQAHSAVNSSYAVSELSDSVKTMTVVAEPKGKDKKFSEIKKTPPVVMMGKTGQYISLTSNYIRLKTKNDVAIHEYEVRITPQVDNRDLNRKLFSQHRDLIGSAKVYDGTTLYIPHKLPLEETVLMSKHPDEDIMYTLKIVYRRPRDLTEVRHLYNVLFKNIMRELQLVRFGRHNYDPSQPHIIPQHRMQVWPGYITAVDEYEGGVMLTVDSSHRVLRTQTVLDLIKELPRGGDWKQNIYKTLVGSCVMTNYNNKLYRVDDILFDKTPMDKFAYRDGELSYVEYYKIHYGLTITETLQPLLISRAEKRQSGTDAKITFEVHLVPEICMLTGLTDDMRNNFTLMKDIASVTRISPNQRHHALKSFLKSVKENPKARRHLEDWGFYLEDETIQLDGRVLPSETIFFGKGREARGIQNADWNKDVCKNPMISCIDIRQWVLLYTKRDERIAGDFVECLLRCGPPMGMSVVKPTMILLPTDKPDVYASALTRSYHESLQLAVCICPTARDDRYSVIKQVCCVQYPMPSQVINARTIMKPDKMRSVVQKIALQINCKLGGTLWSVQIPLQNCMIVGIDSYHEAARRNNSVCGFVASYNASLTHWYSRVCFQKQGQEIVDGLKACFIDSLTFYHNKNGVFPDKIIIYRDGVGDGQLDLVNNYEVEQLKTCFAVVSKGTNYCPLLAYIVVQKRINTRIFTMGREYDNPPPGTVLDHSVTRRDWYDFFIVSQNVRQGTVTPTHYVVLYNGTALTPDQLQRLTYKLTHLYYNWPGTVRVPAPCQYAHKLAYLVGQNMNNKAHSDKLSDRLFFL